MPDLPALVIRPEQMEAFKPVAEAAFARRVAERLQQENPETIVRLPDATLAISEVPNEVLIELVRAAMRRADQYGLNLESTIGAFVYLMFVTAPNFDEHPLSGEC